MVGLRVDVKWMSRWLNGQELDGDNEVDDNNELTCKKQTPTMNQCTKKRTYESGGLCVEMSRSY